MRFVFLFWVMCCCPVLADQVVLQNGDMLEGTFAGVVGGDVIWHATHFGALKIPKAQVKNIHSDGSFKLRGQATPCAWQSLSQQIATFVCHKGEVRTFPLHSLKQVVPYEGHKKRNHSYTGNLRVTGLKKQGNVEAEYWEVHSGVTLRHGDWRHSMVIAFAGQSVVLREGANVTEDKDRKNRMEYGLDWFFLPRFYWSNVFSAEDDSNRNIQEEYKASSGLGYQFWERANGSLASVFGFEHNRTYLKENPLENEPESYTSLRLGTDFKYKFKKGLSLYHNHTYSHSLTAPEIKGGAQRWEFISKSGLDLPIGFGVSADLHLEWNYKNHAKDQNPNAFRKDIIYRVGVNYGW